MALRDAPVAVALFVVVAAPVVALGVASNHPAITVAVTTVVAGALLVNYRGEDAAAARRDVTRVLVVGVLAYGVLVDRILLAVVAACAVRLTGFLTGPDSTLRTD